MVYHYHIGMWKKLGFVQESRNVDVIKTNKQTNEHSVLQSFKMRRQMALQNVTVAKGKMLMIIRRRMPRACVKVLGRQSKGRSDVLWQFLERTPSA